MAWLESKDIGPLDRLDTPPRSGAIIDVTCFHRSHDLGVKYRVFIEFPPGLERHTQRNSPNGLLDDTAGEGRATRPVRSMLRWEGRLVIDEGEGVSHEATLTDVHTVFAFTHSMKSSVIEGPSTAGRKISRLPS